MKRERKKKVGVVDMLSVLTLPRMLHQHQQRVQLLPELCTSNRECKAPEMCECVFYTLKYCCVVPGDAIPSPWPYPVPIPIPVP